MKTEQQLLELYDQAYVERYGRVAPVSRLLRLLPLFELSPSAVVCDFGCGNGMLMPLVAPAVERYVGIDFSAPFIETAEKNRSDLGIANAEFVCARIGDFCASHPDHFDAAFAMDFSEHVYDADWLEILRAILGSLKPGASFYLHTPSGEFLAERMKKRGFILRQSDGHIAIRTPRANAEILERAGFEIVESLVLPHYNRLKMLHPLSRLPWIGGLFGARVFIEARRPAAG